MRKSHNDVRGMITIPQIVDELGLEQSAHINTSVGLIMQERYYSEFGTQPIKENRPKTFGPGVHCFAHYPADYRAAIIEEIRKHKTMLAAQTELFEKGNTMKQTKNTTHQHRLTHAEYYRVCVYIGSKQVADTPEIDVTPAELVVEVAQNVGLSTNVKQIRAMAKELGLTLKQDDSGATAASTAQLALDVIKLQEQVAHLTEWMTQHVNTHARPEVSE